MIVPVGIGDVVVTPVSHAVIVHHVDRAGRWWGIEGRPGGAGWADMRRYRTGELAARAVSAGSPERPDQQRQQVAAAALALLRAPLDATEDAVLAGHLGRQKAGELAALLHSWWAERDGSGLAPGHVAAATLAAWAHETVGLPGPGGARDGKLVTPADWHAWLGTPDDGSGQ